MPARATEDPAQAARPADDTRAGLPARRAAVALLQGVLVQERPFDDVFAREARSGPLSRLAERDRALARAIAATALRRLGQIDAVLVCYLERPLKPKAALALTILRGALAEILFMAAPAHAIVNLAVHQARDDRRSQPFAGLVNAVLRRAARAGEALVAAQDAPRLNTPDWLWQAWAAAHGEGTARRIADANLAEAPLDITVKSDARHWAQRLDGLVVAETSVRLAHKGRIEALADFEAGQWWVQDAAAALPARLLGDVAGKRVADFCAAPGGKTAQLACAGAEVTALDISSERLDRLKDNLARLRLPADTLEADLTVYTPKQRFDAVLLDAPCSATGTIRRHPDIPRLKGPEDVKRLAKLQWRLLANAVGAVRPGGRLVYCTCSLQPEEGEAQIARLLASGAPLRIDPVAEEELSGLAHARLADGTVRTWPFAPGLEGNAECAAVDGFYIARLIVNGPQV